MAMNLGQVRVVDPILSTVVQGYKHVNHVGSALFPVTYVNVSGGKIVEFGKDSFKLFSTRRAPGAATKRIRFGYEGKDYTLENHSIEVPVPREHLRDAKAVPGIDLASRALNTAQQSMSLGLEYEQAQLATNSSNYDNSHKVTLSGSSKWSSSGNPNTDIEAGKEAIRQSTGIYPNTLLLSGQAYKAIKNNSNVLDRFKYTSRDSVTPEMLAALYDLKRVAVGTAVSFDDAGVASDLWGNNAVLAYVPEVPSSMEEPSFGYTYTMEGHPLVEAPYWDQSSKSWIYGVSHERRAVLTGITSGYLIINPN